MLVPHEVGVLSGGFVNVKERFRDFMSRSWSVFFVTELPQPIRMSVTLGQPENFCDALGRPSRPTCVATCFKTQMRANLV